MASCATAILQKMSGGVDQEWRRARLEELIKRMGTQKALGAALGWDSGANVGHMLRGRRPVSEDFIEKVHAIHGLKGWFEKDRTKAVANQANQPPAPWSVKTNTIQSCLDNLQELLLPLDPSTREQVGDLLSHFARGLQPHTKAAILALVEGAGKDRLQNAA